jgi:hypothetical protein
MHGALTSAQECVWVDRIPEGSADPSGDVSGYSFSTRLAAFSSPEEPVPRYAQWCESRGATLYR